MSRSLSIALAALMLACALVAPGAASAAPQAVRLHVVSTHGADRLGWSAATKPSLRWRLLVSSSPAGPFTVVGEYERRRTEATVAVSTPGQRYYRIELVGKGKQGRVAQSPTVGNDLVRASAVVGPAGGQLVSSNGEVALRVPAGALTATTTVVCSETVAPALPGAISMGDTYDMLPSGTAFTTAAELTLRYRVPVSHFQVASKLIDAVELVGRDGAGHVERVNVTVDRDKGTLTGPLAHFSYWSGAVIQPHGTTPAKTSYCSGICHNLVAAPGSAIVIPSRDPQVCYNCHGNTSAALPPAGATGPNVQAEFRAVAGQTVEASSSRHPVGTGAGKMSCTICHNVHRDPGAGYADLLRVYDPSGKALESKPGKPLGSEFCWACHGPTSNPRVSRSVPGYWTASGGDKQTTYVASSHGGSRTAGQRLDTVADFEAGGADYAAVSATGSVVLPLGATLLRKNLSHTLSPVHSYMSNGVTGALYDGDPTSYASWYTPSVLGANASNGYVGRVTAGIDLGEVCRLESYGAAFTDGFYASDVVEVWTSMDAMNWTKVASKGILGVRLAKSEVLSGVPSDCRHVRVDFLRTFPGGSGTLSIAEVDLVGLARTGTWQYDLELARAATLTSATISWKENAPAETSVTVEARSSVGGGAWSAWGRLTNGAPVSQVVAGSSLDKTELQVRTTLRRGDLSVTPSVEWIDLTVTRGALPGVETTWPGGTAARGACANCHLPHGGGAAALGRASGDQLCYRCHDEPSGTFKGESAYAGSVHASQGCASCHVAHGSLTGTGTAHPFQLASSRNSQCFGCHPSVRTAFASATGAYRAWARHDVAGSDKLKSDSTMKCRSCHSPHSKTGLIDPDSATGAAYALYRDDPTSIPTAEVVLYPTKDTVVNSVNPTFNYGASPTVSMSPTASVLLHFDLSAIPAGAEIQNATLVMWSTSSLGAAGFDVKALTRDWTEGTGNGVVNSASVNGATWLERCYGDNAFTGNTAAGDWGVQGGDAGAGMGPQTRENAANVTSGVVQQRASGQNFGMILKVFGGTVTTYMREHGTLQYRPKLRIVYRTGPATRQVLDDVTFCLKCHDGNMPVGIRGQSMLQISLAYAQTAHGSAKGFGPESQSYNRDRGNGSLRPPYSYGMDALPCSDCHDPHGSSNAFHLRESINGIDTRFTTTGVTWTNKWGMTNISSFCRGCHIYPPNHGSAFGAGGCVPCHGHGGSRG